MSQMYSILRNGAQQFNLTLTDAQLAAFEQYSQELIAWNQRVNLTSITAPDEIAVKHFLDSLSLYPLLAELPPTLALIDVGTGAGFPGLPLKLALPQLRLTLLESTGKKTAFLQHLIQVLHLTGVAILTARAEEAGRRPDQRERYDVATARAVAALPVLAEYTLPFVKQGGLVIVQKGQHPADELKAAANALGILGGKVSQILPVTVPGLDAERHLVVIQKIKPTPPQYPRRPGLPAKKPI
ncbi:MAG: 16S rRNA (guanine(527)-N(7))-methyltransferase RsmG [Anaerolineae bacterium]|nr:16S rRNA (guanine(527)-N(7))-methyltransferase RsmG [Anaerolineales bacterium]MCQ3978283.1 16S rRNA (guanine(527)-N(7))-methyltransferase RsmG [Anaerolineae bacterium]